MLLWKEADSLLYPLPELSTDLLASELPPSQRDPQDIRPSIPLEPLHVFLLNLLDVSQPHPQVTVAAEPGSACWFCHILPVCRWVHLPGRGFLT